MFSKTNDVPTRREILRQLFTVPTKKINSDIFPTPPFVAPFDLYLAACNGCGECIKHCPKGIIQLQQNKATLELGFSDCDFCGLCAEVCPTQALHPAFPADTKLRPQIGKNCIQYLQQSCDTCQQSCPQQAISPTLKIDYMRCNGCGICQQQCFISAIELTLYGYSM